MRRRLRDYVRVQASVAAAANAFLNPALAWLGHREREAVPLWGSQGMVVDTLVTAVVLSVLVSLFVAAGVRRESAAGRLEVTGDPSGTGRWLSRFPRRPLAFGLSVGFLFGTVLVTSLLGASYLAGITALSFAAFAALKAVYTSLAAFAVARWVILRQVSAGPRA